MFVSIDLIAGWLKKTPEKNINGQSSDMVRDEALSNEGSASLKKLKSGRHIPL